MLSHICLCTPVHRNWQIQPYPGGKNPIFDSANEVLTHPRLLHTATASIRSDSCLQRPVCDTRSTQNSHTTNIDISRSDILILIIPIPILTKLQVPLQRKLILVIMFSSGVFIMICTILRAYYSLGDITNLPLALGWADRECFVAAIVVSLPGIKPLFRNTRWLGSSNRKASNSPYSNSGYNNFNSKTSGKTKTFISSRRSGSFGRHFEMDSVMRTEKSTRISTGGSEECILDDAKGASMSSKPMPQNSPSRDPLAIHVTTELSLEEEGSRAPRSSDGRSFG